MKAHISVITLGVRDVNRAKKFYVVRSEARVDAVLAEAERAGGKIAKPAQRAQWGGYFGYFADPDGYLWKAAVGAGFAAE